MLPGVLLPLFPHALRPGYRKCHCSGWRNQHGDMRPVPVLEALARRSRDFIVRLFRRHGVLHSGWYFSNSSNIHQYDDFAHPAHPFSFPTSDQGGQFVLQLVDYYAGSFIVFVLATFEVTGIFWVYGLENFLDDVEFMLSRRPSVYWRICWGIITPVLLTAILIYTIAIMKPLEYSGIAYPDSAHSELPSPNDVG